MKILYIEDTIHSQLKKEAKQQGRTLKWLVEEKLTGTSPTTMPSKYPPLEDIREVTFLPDSQEYDPKLEAMIKSGQIKRGI